MEETGWEVDIHHGGDSKGGYGAIKNGGIHPAVPEYGCIVHHYAITIRPM